MGTVGAIRERDLRGRFTSRPSPYQGSRPGANVSGPTGLTMDTALAGESCVTMAHKKPSARANEL